MRGQRPFLGIPDEALESHPPGVMTKEEVRAVALFKLRLQPDSLVWDVGAGSGSLALEAALVAHRGHVYAVERRAEAVAALRRNLERFPRPNLTVVEGQAPEALDGLPDPDAVFVGGSGGHLADILGCAARRLRAGGRIVVDLATLENLERAREALACLGLRWQVTAVQVARSRELGGLTGLEALNPVFIVSAWKEEP
ncbi:MAG: precorrin-6Y C5,15-methyltransferase (decarboxylating) subunit CbiT [Dehalococcoidia bacterium]|jgi:precorrin-6Y C5,15-methyltransferase (decarboxylating)|nr:precorrin-6Y C5,15-methyltransferase (decarboxylating) subunit CbiT [Dehalococcoidia bacterium]MDW8008750.1 precorrin-6Y C5,15-methyltransferase (decarboxylating) subunit CbiT [Chloroflexota bacterium]